jgi:Flp pilus assembly protein protease CpaA
MWILGTAGGGDVKQFAAASAWVGPLWVIYLLIGTIIAVVILSGVLLIYRVFTGGLKSVSLRTKKPTVMKDDDGKLKLARGKRVGWSVPATIAMALFLLWVLRVDLGLQEPKPPKIERTPGTEQREAP